MSKSRLKYSLLLVPAIALFASGCANRNSIIVGSTPDDYRTNHPIMISEKEQVLDLPVGSSDRGATRRQTATLEGFLYNYDKSAAPVVTILTPAGSANSHAAGLAARDFARIARQNGVPSGRIMMSTYQAGSTEVAAPVRVTYAQMAAQTGKCGQWGEDIAPGSDNKLYKNFGCSYQNNLAAQLENPNDLIGPRKQTTIDADNRSVAIGDYKNQAGSWSPMSDY